VSAARELFLKNEYEKTTLQHVMNQLGIAKGTIYHYFKSKEDLLYAVIDVSVEQYVEGVQAVINETKGNALQRMRVLISASSIEDENKEAIEQLHQPGNIGMHARQLALTIFKLAPLYAQVIDQGCKEGVFQTEHPLESAEFLLGGIQLLTDVGIYPWSKEDLSRRQMAIGDLIEGQLKAPKGSFAFLRG